MKIHKKIQGLLYSTISPNSNIPVYFIYKILSKAVFVNT